MKNMSPMFVHSQSSGMEVGIEALLLWLLPPSPSFPGENGEAGSRVVVCALR